MRGKFSLSERMRKDLSFFFFTEFDLCSIKEPKFDTYAATISPPCWFLTIKIPTRLNHRSNERYLQEFSVKCFLFWFLNLFHKTIKKKLVTARKLLQHIYNYNWHPTWATTGQNTHFKSIDMCYKHTHTYGEGNSSVSGSRVTVSAPFV